jgi:hypothetical protein
MVALLPGELYRNPRYSGESMRSFILTIVAMLAIAIPAFSQNQNQQSQTEEKTKATAQSKKTS